MLLFPLILLLVASPVFAGEANPIDAKTYFQRGRAKVESGKFDEALADFTKAIGLNPRYAV